MKRFVINSNDAGQRVDKFITKACPALPQSALYKGIRTKNIKLNRKRCEISTRLAEGDILELYLPDELLMVPDRDDFMSAPAKLDIVYEDENIILIDKKNGLVVHEDDDNTADTLANRLRHYLYDKGEYIPDSESSFAPALCNRLDRNTGGIVIAAKNAEALRIMNEKIRNRELDKRYLCITAGIPPKKSDTIEAYLYKDSRTNTVTVSDKSTPANKKIVTAYKVLDTKDGFALCEVELLTGRTHQIRAHMAHIGCPLLGDGKYGDNRINRAAGVKTQALYSYKLSFDFTSPSGVLSYLDGKTFEVKDIWVKEFWNKI